MKRNSPTVSIIVNAHNENLLLHKTLKSVNENIRQAKLHGINAEVIIVADKVDEPSLNYLKSRAETALTEVPFTLEEVSYGDLGESRNHGIRLAKGDYIANIDGDDLWSVNWITDAVSVLEKKPQSIAHHAAVLNFGSKNGVWHIKGSDHPSFNPRSVVEDNWWSSSMMTSRETFDKIQYRRVDRPREFSFEDWFFNNEALAAGFEHVVVPETTFFYRRKPVSMLTAHISGLPEPNPMFTLEGQKNYVKNRRITDQEDVDSSLPSNREVAIPSRDGTTARRMIIKTVKRSGKITVKTGKKLFGKQINSHYRVKRYLLDIKNATHTLIADPNENIAGARKVVPGWLRAQWLEANAIEPELFPTHRRVATAYNRAMMTMGPEQQAYWDILEAMKGTAEYILFVPYVRTAGAYMVGMHYLRAYKELHPKAKVVVMATELTYPSDESLIPSGVELITVPRSFTSLNNDLKSRVLAKILTNVQPKYTHVLHSQEGFRALQRYPKQVSKYSKILLSTFNYDYTAEGQKMNGFLAYSAEILPYVYKVFTDNEWVADDTIDIFGIEPNKVSAHAMPIKISDEKSEGVNLRDIDGKMRILWAARLAKQKRPDILYDIAKKAHKTKQPYEFIVYGTLYDKIITQSLITKLTKLPNVQFRGAFNKGIGSLPTSEFEVYLSTSEAEGTPNAILEAQERGLIAVAPKLGGIPEAIQNKKTGMLVEDFTNVDQYLDALKYIYDNESRAKKLAEAGRKSIEGNRTWLNFVNQVKRDL